MKKKSVKKRYYIFYSHRKKGYINVFEFYSEFYNFLTNLVLNNEKIYWVKTYVWSDFDNKYIEM